MNLYTFMRPHPVFVVVVYETRHTNFRDNEYDIHLKKMYKYGICSVLNKRLLRTWMGAVSLINKTSNVNPVGKTM